MIKAIHWIDCSIDRFDQDLIRRWLGFLKPVADLGLHPSLLKDDAFHIDLGRMEGSGRICGTRNTTLRPGWDGGGLYMREGCTVVYVVRLGLASLN